MAQPTWLFYCGDTTGYRIYRDADERRWYAPSTDEKCEECGGVGCNDDGDMCVECFGNGTVITPDFDHILSEPEYRSVLRQRHWLEHRYGNHIPVRIADYWQS